MYDVHCHLMPDVDDGPGTVEDALLLLKTAYDSGTRHLVLTPHLNHPMKFKGSEDFHRHFHDFATQVRAVLPGLKLYLGSEVYISRERLEAIGALQILPINGSRYVLIEFSRQIKAEEAERAVEELLLMGYKPIIAHVELYQSLRADMELLRRIKADGGLLQVNAEHLTGPEHARLKPFIEGLISEGMVDFVASDGHSNQRLPHLQEAYALVSKRWGADYAQSLFLGNPKAMLEDRAVPAAKPSIRQKKLPGGKRGVAAAVALCLLLGVAAGMGYARSLEQADHMAAESGRTMEQGSAAKSEIGTEEVREDGDGATLSVQMQADEVETLEPSQEKMDEPGTAQSAALEAVTGAVAEAAVAPPVKPEISEALASEEAQLTQVYVDYLKQLEGYYLGEIDRYYAMIGAAAQIEDGDERTALLEQYQDELGALESRADNEVYKALYDMQNDLEAGRYDTAICKTLRDHYVDEKIAVSNKYKAALESRLE